MDRHPAGFYRCRCEPVLLLNIWSCLTGDKHLIINFNKIFLINILSPQTFDAQAQTPISLYHLSVNMRFRSRMVEKSLQCRGLGVLMLLWIIIRLNLIISFSIWEMRRCWEASVWLRYEIWEVPSCYLFNISHLRFSVILWSREILTISDFSVTMRNFRDESCQSCQSCKELENQDQTEVCV